MKQSSRVALGALQCALNGLKESILLRVLVDWCALSTIDTGLSLVKERL